MSPRTNFFWIESIQGKKFWYSEISESKRIIRINDDADDDDFLRINDDAELPARCYLHRHYDSG